MMRMFDKKADVICDLQFGSTGKGLIAGVLAKKHRYDAVVTCNMPNAGHTFVDSNGVKYVHHIIGNGVVSPNINLVMIGPGSVFDPHQLVKEVHFAREQGNHFNLIIHETAWVLSQDHREAEQHMTAKIGSTAQGSSAAMIERIQRDMQKWHENLDQLHYLCGGITNAEVVDNKRWLQCLDHSENILVEGSQGYSLGISAGFYPFCTSRDCTPARIMSDCGVPLNMLRHVIGTARTFPIRVGGNSGDGYPDQAELDWEASLGIEPEKTTTTGRDRRIFTFSMEQISQAVRACQPNKIFLNFCNYIENDEDLSQLIDDVDDIGIRLCSEYYGIRYLGFGPTEQNVEVNDFEHRK